MRIMIRRHDRRGFSLIELLVGIAIFSMLMAAIVTIFQSSLRTARTTEANVDMATMARGAVTVIERDLTSAFTARDFGEHYQFFGTRSGFMMVGLAPGGGLQRTTWVVAHRSALSQATMAPDIVTTTDEDATGDYKKIDTMVLLRYVERGVEDLDTFYFYWDISGTGDIVPATWEDVAANPDGGAAADRLHGSTNSLDDFLAASGENYTAAEQAELYNVVERELWLRMLVGEPGLPQFWAAVDADGVIVPGDPRPDFMDYVVAEGIEDPDDPDARADAPFFQYIRLLADANSREYTSYWSTVFNEQGYRLYDNVQDPGNPDKAYPGYDLALGDPLQPRLPDAVEVNLTFLVESPILGAPDQRRRLKQIIDVPSAYTRSFP